MHVDTIDLIDSPAVRFALAGKDVLLHPGMSETPKNVPVPNGQPMLSGGETPLINRAGALLDIDDIVTPGLVPRARSPAKQQVRAYHTLRPMQESCPTSTTEAQDINTVPPEAPAPTPPRPKRVPAMPSYAGFSTSDLQKQIKAYGFKPIKSREKMIDVLERCWEDKHGIKTTEPEAETVPEVDARTHGDFLSEVHDVSARPVPKVKKPKERKRRSDTNGEETRAKEPKKRKKAEPRVKSVKNTDVETKTPRKRKTKAKTLALSEERGVDV